MLTETLFSIANTIVVPFWLLMIALPKWTWTKRIIGSVWIILPPALIYVFMLLSNFDAGGMTELMNPTAETIGRLLSSPEGATTGWSHFLALDLFAGRWVYLDNQTQKLPNWLVSVCLLFIFMTGPLGLIAYLFARLFKRT